MNKIKVSRTILRWILLIFLIAPGLYVMGQSGPTAVTGTASGVTAYQATLNGTVNANGESTTVIFEYGTDTSYGITYTAAQSPVSGSSDTAVSVVIYELSPNTTYHYRVVARNVNGTTYGADMTFTTSPLPPSVLTNPASALGVDSATLNGVVNPRGVSADVTFEYGTDTSYGTTVTADQSPLNSALAVPVSKTITGLSAGITYHYRVVAVSTGGTTYGDDMTFTLTVSPPTAVTGAATAVGSETATLNGTANANGTVTTVTFEYGLDTSYGTTITATQNPLTGDTDTAVSKVVDDVQPNTTYHYRLVAVNAGGTTYGADMTFTTLPSPPTAVTGSASAVGTTTATLNGTVNANDGSTTVTFEYGLDTGYGTTVTAAQSPVTGSTDTTVSAALTGLSDGVTYHYRLVAINAGGTTYGADMTFATGAVAPTAVTNAAGGVGTTTATLNGTVNANNGSTTVTFQYGLDTNYDRSANGVPGTVTGSSDTAVSVSVSNLIPGATYHYRVMAVNAGGTAYGADMTFTTRAAPAVTTGAASAVSTTGATLNGTVNAFNDSTAVTFEYGTTAAYGTTVNADQSPVSGVGATAVSKVITGLAANTVYHYRAVGQNINGTTYGADMTFTTSVGPPTVTTAAATSVLSDRATLNGTVTANNASTTVTFEYGTTTAYGSTITAVQSPVTGVNTAVSAVLTGLSNNTTYHYRVVGQNANGTAYDADMTFSTSNAPTAVTNAATGVGASSATLNGTANANNFNTNVSFQYGTTTSYGSTVAADPSFVTGNTDTAVSAALTGLLPNTTYHYRVAAQGFGTTYGADMSFTTGSGPTAVTNAASAIGASGATLNGTVNANNLSTTVTFEYGLNTAYGKSAAAAQSPVSGSTNTSVSVVLSNELVPNTTYHYRVLAQNTNDTAYGADMTFTTTGSAPTATTNAATAVSGTGATLRGTVNAKNDSTTVTFEYGLTTAYGTTVPANQSPVTGDSNTSVSRTVTGLTANTTYHYRVTATNSSGTTYGSDRTFFTSSTAPTAETLAATNIGFTTAVLNGMVNANGNSTTVTFEFGPDTNYGRTAVATQSPVTGSTDTAVSVNVAYLSPNSTVHYRVVASSSSGTTYGSDMTFFTGAAAPTAVTAAASDIGTESATLNGLVNANNAETTVTFEYGTDTNYGSSVTADQSPVTGTVETAVSVGVTGLAPGTEYHFRVKAENSQGTTYGADMTFTTDIVMIPTVITAPVTKIGTKTAKSGGNVIDEGAAPVTSRGVCWSTAPNPTLADNFTVNGYGPGPFKSRMKRLTENTTYYVRAYAVNSYGTAYGEEFEFTTNSKNVKVTIIKPKDGKKVSGTVTIKVNAKGKAGSQSVAKVEIYIDDTKIDELVKVPFKSDWDTTGYTNGSHMVKAVAFNEDNESSQDVITVTVNNPDGNGQELSVNRNLLVFNAVPKGKKKFHVTGAQTVLIDTNGGKLHWTIDTDAGWLSASPHKGNGPRMVDISVDPKGLAAGTYSGSLRITSPDASNGSVTVAVQFTISDNTSSSVPFGAFETPVDGAVVTGNISVTGWVLDDVEVTGVSIFREPVGNETGGLKFVGDANLVDDARPDMETTYSNYPLSYRAGWGYLLMTHLLPDQGSSFTLVAKATDKEGNMVTLGTKTVTVDNDNAVEPFGAIDTPGYGEQVEGSNYVNFGWALTPQPNTIPTDGSTIVVWVDGIPLGNPVYNQYRDDVASMFPGYNNSDGAGGYFYLDTTLYSNGNHTIAWSVTDDAGNSAGIGSRYFTIVNSGNSGNSKSAGMTAGNIEDLEHIAPNRMEPGFIKKGFHPNAQAEALLPDESGIASVTIKELERVELELGNTIIAGYLVTTRGDLKVLPTGSTVEYPSGRFSWLPGPGYMGDYLMVFVLEDATGQHTRTLIRVTIEPGFKK
jgi:phosphodiesterase/alkaline phosphatase D-like protein